MSKDEVWSLLNSLPKNIFEKITDVKVAEGVKVFKIWLYCQNEIFDSIEVGQLIKSCKNSLKYYQLRKHTTNWFTTKSVRLDFEK